MGSKRQCRNSRWSMVELEDKVTSTDLSKRHVVCFPLSQENKRLNQWATLEGPHKPTVSFDPELSIRPSRVDFFLKDFDGIVIVKLYLNKIKKCFKSLFHCIPFHSAFTIFLILSSTLCISHYVIFLFNFIQNLFYLSK